MAEFASVMHQYRHAFAVAPLQFRVSVDVDDCDIEMKKALQSPQGLDHFIAQVTIGAAVDGQNQWRLSCHSVAIDAERNVERIGAAAHQQRYDPPFFELSHHLVELLD